MVVVTRIFMLVWWVAVMLVRVYVGLRCMWCWLWSLNFVWLVYWGMLLVVVFCLMIITWFVLVVCSVVVVVSLVGLLFMMIAVVVFEVVMLGFVRAFWVCV